MNAWKLINCCIEPLLILDQGFSISHQCLQTNVLNFMRIERHVRQTFTSFSMYHVATICAFMSVHVTVCISCAQLDWNSMSDVRLVAAEAPLPRLDVNPNLVRTTPILDDWKRQDIDLLRKLLCKADDLLCIIFMDYLI